jgi:hypothetical protein
LDLQRGFFLGPLVSTGHGGSQNSWFIWLGMYLQNSGNLHMRHGPFAIAMYGSWEYHVLLIEIWYIYIYICIFFPWAHLLLGAEWHEMEPNGPWQPTRHANSQLEAWTVEFKW